MLVEEVRSQRQGSRHSCDGFIFWMVCLGDEVGAFAYLDIFQSNDLGMRVFIVTEPPNDTGINLRNCAEIAAARGLGHLFMGDEKGRPVGPQMIYIEHHPETVFAEKFSIVTFTPSGMSIKNEIVEVAPATGLGAAYQATWVRLDRAQVGRLIGQEFAPDRS